MTSQPPTSAAPPKFFATPAAFRTWLQRNAESEESLLVGFWKVDSGKPSMTSPESVDEALCVGWIDGVRKRIDDTAYTIRFSPRRKGSFWSSVNIKRVETLNAEGRMQPAGLKAYAARAERDFGGYAYEQRDMATLDTSELRRFKQQKSAWTYFEATPPGYRKTMLFWVTSAKQAPTRARRLDRLIAACAAGERVL